MLYKFARGIVRLFLKACFRFRAEGLEHIPAEGPVILCSNHISNLDPLAVAAPLERQARFMAKAELFKIPLLNKLIHGLGAFPVKRGGVSKEAIRTSLNILKEGGLLCIFPEGTRSDTVGMGKKGAASFALKSRATVIPAAISSYRWFKPNRVLYGKPVDLSAYYDEPGSEQLEKATEAIMSSIKQLLDKD